MKSAQRQFLVKVGTLPGYFATKSGGNVTADVNKVYDGGSLTPDLVTAPAVADNITVSRPYDVTRDPDLLATLRAQVGSYTATLTVQPTDRDLAPVGRAAVYPNAVLVAVNEPDIDASSGTAATYELDFAIGTFT